MNWELCKFGCQLSFQQNSHELWATTWALYLLWPTVCPWVSVSVSVCSLILSDDRLISVAWFARTVSRVSASEVYHLRWRRRLRQPRSLPSVRRPRSTTSSTTSRRSRTIPTHWLSDRWASSLTQIAESLSEILCCVCVCWKRAGFDTGLETYW